MEMKMKCQKPLSGSLRRFLYVISSEKAKKNIAKFREKWKIHPGGFKNKNDYYQWLEEIIAHPPIKFERVVLKNKITRYAITKDRINKDIIYGSPTITDKNAKPIRYFNDNFQKAVDELGVEIGMDNNWCYLFTEYLRRGDKILARYKEASLDILKITEYYEEGKPVKEKLIMIIEPNITKEEVISAWERFIEKGKNSMVGFIKVPPHQKVNILR